VTTTTDSAVARLLRAARFAEEKHRMPRRKGPDASSCINHPLSVAEVLSRHGVEDAATR